MASSARLSGNKRKGEGSNVNSKAEKKSSKSPWTQVEDEILKGVIRNIGANAGWSTIASHVAGRSAKQCRERWTNHLDPSLTKLEWTLEEEKMLVQLRQYYGNKWTTIAKHIPGRSDNGIKNHWYTHVKLKEERGDFNDILKKPITPAMLSLTAAAAAASSSIVNNINNDMVGVGGGGGGVSGGLMNNNVVNSVIISSNNNNNNNNGGGNNNSSSAAALTTAAVGNSVMVPNTKHRRVMINIDGQANTGMSMHSPGGSTTASSSSTATSGKQRKQTAAMYNSNNNNSSDDSASGMLLLMNNANNNNGSSSNPMPDDEVLQSFDENPHDFCAQAGFSPRGDGTQDPCAQLDSVSREGTPQSKDLSCDGDDTPRDVVQLNLDYMNINNNDSSRNVMINNNFLVHRNHPPHLLQHHYMQQQLQLQQQLQQQQQQLQQQQLQQQLHQQFQQLQQQQQQQLQQQQQQPPPFLHPLLLQSFPPSPMSDTMMQMPPYPLSHGSSSSSLLSAGSLHTPLPSIAQALGSSSFLQMSSPTSVSSCNSASSFFGPAAAAAASTTASATQSAAPAAAASTSSSSGPPPLVKQLSRPPPGQSPFQKLRVIPPTNRSWSSSSLMNVVNSPLLSSSRPLQHWTDVLLRTPPMTPGGSTPHDSELFIAQSGVLTESNSNPYTYQIPF